MSRKTRVRELESLVGDGNSGDCPMVAIGTETEGGYMSGGTFYTAADIDRCFPRGRFIILDDGPTERSTE